MAKAPIEIRSLARSHTEAALKTLKAIMSDPDANAGARVSAAVALLDRGWGKAEAKLTIDHKRDASEYSRADLEALLAESVARNGSAGTAAEDGRGSGPDSVH